MNQWSYILLDMSFNMTNKSITDLISYTISSKGESLSQTAWLKIHFSNHRNSVMSHSRDQLNVLT